MESTLNIFTFFFGKLNIELNLNKKLLGNYFDRLDYIIIFSNISNRTVKSALNTSNYSFQKANLK